MSGECKCKWCGCEIVDGENGTVYELPPWADPGTPVEAGCYGCENRLEMEAEDQRVADSINAAQRAGRFDLI